MFAVAIYLSSVTNAYSTSYGYDPLGNRLTKNASGQVTNYQYNSANALTVTTPPSGPATTQSFDANGNLTLQNTGGALTTYSWDGENRLTSVVSASGTEAYSYSTDGLRQKKVTPSGTTNLVWDNQNLLQERDGSLNKIAQYTDFPGFWGGLASQRRGGVSGFYGFDSQSSSRVLVSVSGLVTDSYAYKAFGEELAAGSGTANPFRYVGAYGYYRDVVSRDYVRARHLDVLVGRWVSRDPIGFAGGDWNVYRYGDNRPVQYLDPSGRAPLECPKCNIPKSIGLSDSRYRCYKAACEQYSSMCSTIEGLDGKFCEPTLGINLQDCADTNACLPDIRAGQQGYVSECDRQIDPFQHLDPTTWSRAGGGRSHPSRYWPWFSYCCVECQVRLCNWVVKPRIDRALAWLNFAFSRCSRGRYPLLPPPDVGAPSWLIDCIIGGDIGNG